jgi:ribosomal protein S18 acetylase RimI-like enzyme
MIEQTKMMHLEIIVPTTDKELMDGRELSHEYIDHLSSHPNLQQYFELQNFHAEIDNMPEGYKSPFGVFLVGYINGLAAGTVAVRRLNKKTCEMKRLYVRPSFQGHRLGQALAERALLEAKNLGYSKMRLDNSRSVMGQANAIYKKLGFYEIERYNQNSVEDACFMEKMLS